MDSAGDLLLDTDIAAMFKKNKVYGNYCGPDWCSGKSVSEDKCPFTAPTKDHLDSCCKAHDQCCGSSETTLTCKAKGCDRKLAGCAAGGLVKCGLNVECQAWSKLLAAVFSAKATTPTCCGKILIKDDL